MVTSHEPGRGDHQGGIAAKGIQHERDGRVGYITLDRPPLNILNIAAFDRLAEVVEEFTLRDAVDIIVIRAAGEKAFCAGADVSEHTPELAPRMLASFHRVARLLWETDAVSIAAVQGVALGGGMELALCCDLVLAAEAAQFGQPEIKVGCFPPIAAALLPARVGRHHAADIILTGRKLSAFEALALGLVSRLASPGEFEVELGRLIAALRENSGPVMRSTVKAMRGAGATEFSHALDSTERIYLEELLKLDDAREGVEAFLQKRKPRWKGQGTTST